MGNSIIYDGVTSQNSEAISSLVPYMYVEKKNTERDKEMKVE